LKEKVMKQSIWKSAAFAAGLVLAAGAVHAQTLPPECNVPDNGTGTVTLPPAGCNYLSPDQVHMIIDGLPAGTTIILEPIHRDFICRQASGTSGCGTPGGILGGEVEQFSSVVTFKASGTGALAGWSRTISVPTFSETHTGPRNVGAPTQSFPTNMYRLQGSLPAGDPDFASLDIIGGTGNGFPSPGQTTLTRKADGTWDVASDFNIGYSIKFVGTPNGKLSGFGGSTDGTAHMKAFSAKPAPTTDCVSTK
jgi:hypothetical protein